MRLRNNVRGSAVSASTLAASLIMLASPVFAQQNNDNNRSSTSSESSSQSSSSASVERTTSAASRTSSSADSSSSFPTVSGITSSNSFPTLSSASSSALPTYPAPSVPPTKDAPFMKQSSMPEGTVFIAVGAILGAFAIALLIWRLVVGALLAKSISRAKAAESHGPTTKKKHPPPPAQFYGYSDHQSNLSLGPGGHGTTGSSRATKRANRSSQHPASHHAHPSNSNNSNLFFSPTAAATSGGGGGNRSSTFLPSGFYAATASQPGATHHHTQSISLSNLRPESRGHYPSASRGSLNQTPPDSPYFHARRDLSSSSINLNQPPGQQQRAPSAYLEDLLTDDPAAFPPPHMPSGGNGGSGRSSPAHRY